MAVPKKKMSRSRTRRRKAQWKVSAPMTVKCRQCGLATLPHRACSACGTYRGREVVEVDSP
ncbi:MAG: 50S ribosomal protein L32 [Acidobacteria bacterium]|nr:50S ribosomal protein L32 [Acidobacteriota bacterium]MCH8985434.1 50S ribosomal protein L32 [Acidobacteriota bacterium]